MLLTGDDDLRNRFRRAAMTLFRDQGFDRTTTAQIAKEVGVTNRTFFRYYPDKRDVLFEGESAVRTLLIAAIANAPPDLSPLDAVLRALRIFQPVLEAFRGFAKTRHEIIRSTPALQEREAFRTRALVATLEAALVSRGAEALDARLAAGSGMAGFVLAAHAWLEADDVDFGASLDRTFGVLRALLSGMERRGAQDGDANA